MKGFPLNTQVFIVLLIFSPFVIFIGIFLLNKQKERSVWKRSFEKDFPADWVQILEKNFHPYLFLDETEKQNLHQKIIFFLEDKNITGVAGFEVTDEMKLLIAAEACLLIVNLSAGVFPDLKNIYLVEDAFIQNDNPINPATGQPFYVARLGEAWKAGPIVLSWAAVLQGLKTNHTKSNVVYHEFSHNLDQQDGKFDGTPKLKNSRSYERWAQIMGHDFMELRQNVGHHHKSDIDSYGATNEAEFFAVCSEYFFTQPLSLEKRHPEAFQLFLDFFKIDPRRWDKP